MKKYFLLILLLLAGAFLTGCAEVTFEVKSSAKGEITQTLIVKPDYELLDQNGYSKETVNERIITIFNSVIKSQEDQFKAHNLFTMTLSQQKEILSKVKHNYKFDSQNNTIILSNHFDTYTDYIYYYCLVEEVLTDTDNLEKNPFFYTSINQSKSIFSSVKNSNLENYIKQMFSFKEICPFNIEDLTYNYVYATTDSKQRSNADTITFKDDLYYHTWNIDGSNLDKEIYFKKYTHIVRVNWYYLALVLSFCFFMILMIINEITQIKKQKFSTKE